MKTKMMKESIKSARTCTEKYGLVEIEYERGTGVFLSAGITLVEDELGLTFNWTQTRAFLRICEGVFENSQELERQGSPSDLVAEIGLTFIGPLGGRKDLFWFCNEGIRFNVPIDIVQVAYKDLQRTLDRLGGPERFKLENHC